MIQKLIISMIINFVLRQLEKFQKTIDWVKVKADADARIAALIPGTWFDEQAIAAANMVLDAVACALSQTAAFDEILNLVAQQKWTEAADRLKQLVMDVWGGDSCPVQKNEQAVAMVEAFEPKFDEAV